jgi:hypothetical protein
MKWVAGERLLGSGVAVTEQEVSFSKERGGPAAVVAANSGRPRTATAVESTMARALAAVG